ncbi:hypothetical protein BGW80DRAFT_1466890 [Lactifluus volemus]|nr:hypothetical protein BGW80DRAFT_1466890 [Lactifluus volemus]
MSDLILVNSLRIVFHDATLHLVSHAIVIWESEVAKSASRYKVRMYHPPTHFSATATSYDSHAPMGDQDRKDLADLANEKPSLDIFRKEGFEF